MLTALNEVTNLVQDVNATSEGRLCVQDVPKHQDLGEIISGVPGGSGYQLAAGATVYSSEYSGLGWVRNYIIAVRSNQNYISGIARVVAGTTTGVVIFTRNAADPTAAADAVNSANSSGFNLLGDVCKFYVKNNGAAAGNIWAYVQLMS